MEIVFVKTSHTCWLGTESCDWLICWLLVNFWRISLANDKPCDDVIGCLVTHANLLEFDWLMLVDEVTSDGYWSIGVFSFLEGAILMFESDDCRMLLDDGVVTGFMEMSGVFKLGVFKLGVFKLGLFDDFTTFLTFGVAGTLFSSMKFVLGFLGAVPANTGTVWGLDVVVDDAVLSLDSFV